MRQEACRKRSVLGDCLECSTGFALEDGECQIKKTSLLSLAAVACTTSITSCTTCLSPNFCTVCASPLVPNAQGTACISNCTNTNCLVCATSLACQICQNGYTLLAGNCIQTSLTGCSQYSGSNICTGCYTGYTLNTQTNTCSFANCQYPCATCDNNGKCITCMTPFASSAFDNGTCFTCPIPNCLSCNANSQSICAQCAAGYTPNSANTVCSWGCPSPLCTVCTTSAGTSTCTQCVSGYTLNAAVCLKCQNAPICTQCSPTNTASCSQCMAGYYVTSSNTCSPCAISTCISCTNNGAVCTAFMPATGLQAYTSTTLTPQATFPYACDTGCSQCASNYPAACLVCSPGYYIQVTNNVGQCMPCGSNCMTCSPTSPTTCYSCFSNAFYVATSNTCVSCNPLYNCLTCTQASPNVCTSCPYGYYLPAGIGGYATCAVACPANCLTCFNALGTSLAGLNPGNVACSSCEVGYSLSVTGACLPCVANCRVCSGQFQNICLECGPGFYLNNNYACTQCSTLRCLTCTPAGCLTCAPGYNLQIQNGNTVCAAACAFPCAACSNTNAFSCTACVFGYTLSGTSCQLSSCVTSNSNACEYCPMGSYPNGGTCSACGVGCGRCNPSSINQCTSCLPGFYLGGSNNCVACPTQCATCSGPNNCLTCASRYTAATVPVASNQAMCVACSPPCLECSYNPEQCISCISGFSFTGWNCISNFYYYFTATFSANQQTFFNHYQALIGQFTYALQTKNNKAISAQQITTGPVSTQVTFWMTTVEESDSRKSANEYSNLKFALLQQEGNTLAGMPVTSQELGYKNGVIFNTYSNVPTYCAIFIPLGIVIIFFITYFICSRNDMDLPGNNYIPPPEPSKEVDATEMKSI